MMTRTIISGEDKSNEQYHDFGLDKTVIHTLLESDLSPEEKSFTRLWQEAQVIIGAGGETSAHALTTTQFHILNNPEVHKKLFAELIEALPNASALVDVRVVEHLPYLVGFVASETYK
jgi:cytochrome P450